MTQTTRRSPADRDRAVARLRTLTIGSAVGGLVAMGAFGAVAAASNRGTESAAIVTAAISTSGTATSTGTNTIATPAPTSTSNTSTSTTTPTVTSTSGSVHATSGGS
jgi:hypothetical protein